MKLPRIDPAEVVEVIDRELRRLDPGGGPGRGAGSRPGLSPAEPININDLPSHRFADDLPPFSFQDRYRLDTFLAYHDEEFITNAYRGILKRHPDPVGRDHYLGALRSGSLSKIEILGRLRLSPEGRSKGVRIQGLFLPFAVQTCYHLPVVGYGARLLVGLVRLPTIIANWQRFEAFFHARCHRLDRNRRDESKLLAARINDLVDGQNDLLAQIEDLKTRLEQLEAVIPGTDANAPVDEPGD